MDQIESYLEEVIMFFRPLIIATDTNDSFVAYLKKFGIELDGSTISEDFLDIKKIMKKLTEDELSQGDEAIKYGKEIFLTLKKFTIISSKLLGDIFDSLLYEYLTTRLPFISAILRSLGVLKLELREETNLDYEYYFSFNWKCLDEFISDNFNWSKKVYLWNDNFDYTLALNVIYNLINESLFAFSYKKTIDNPVKFLSNTDSETVYKEVCAPFFQSDFDYNVVEEFVNAIKIAKREYKFEEDDTPVFTKEIGIKIIPIGDLNIPQNLGLAVTPYAKGDNKGEEPLIESEKLKFKYKLNANTTGGIYIAMTPGNIELIGDPSSLDEDFEFEFGLNYENKDIDNNNTQPVILVGKDGSSKLQADAILGSIGGLIGKTSEADFYLSGGFKGLKATIDVSDDGLLNFIIPKPIEIDAGNIIMGWRTGRGVYFDGGTSLRVTVPLNIDLGAISIYELGVLLDWEDGVETTVFFTGDLNLGPIYAYVEEGGLKISIIPTPEGDGVIGKYDLKFGFEPPTGYAIALDASVITGGGLISVSEDEYRGALALKFSTFSFSAFAILNTKLPGGKDGFSMAASIFGEFIIPLGYGFFLTGLGGVIGINRTINTDAMREVLYAGRFDNLLFPEDPIENARTILEDMAAVLPPEEGQHFFGPVARISWGQPVLINVTLGVVIEVGDEFRVLIVGGLNSALPTPDVAIIDLKLSFFGEIDFAAKTISFDASLQSSRILNWAISGDSAVRTGWGKNPDFVASFGGLHPQYPTPANFPKLRRLSINFGTNNPKVTMSAYNAITLNSVQFGARVNLYAKGPKIFGKRLAAEGWAFFDTLISFNPFAFHVALCVGLKLLVDGDVKCVLGADLRLSGPNTYRISGKVWATICYIDIDFKINHTWGASQSIANIKVDGVKLLHQAITESKGFEPIAPEGRSSGVSFKNDEEIENTIDPIGGLRFLQRAVPLGIIIEKIGEAHIEGPLLLDIEIVESDVAYEIVKMDYVRGHFFKLSESEKLRAPTFESHKAGFMLAADKLSVPSNKAITSTYDYEYIKIEMVDDRYATLNCLKSQSLISDQSISRYVDVFHENNMRPPESIKKKLAPANPVEVIKHSRYIEQSQVVEASQSVQLSDNTLVNAFSDFQYVNETLTGCLSHAGVNSNAYTNPAVADYIAASQYRA